jgi:hypothetical protein
LERADAPSQTGPGASRRLEHELAVERHASALHEDYRASGVMKNGGRFGSPSKPYAPPPIPEGKINTSDPDSTLVHGMRGWVQGDDAQAVCKSSTSSSPPRS